MRTLKIIDQLPTTPHESPIIMDTWIELIDRWVCRYTKRPDGSWYKLTYEVDGDIPSLYELIESGLEPYQAFEVIAL